MLGNLFWIFLCIWLLMGFIAYGIQIASNYYNKDDLKDPCFKIFFMFLCMGFGPVGLYLSMKDEKLHWPRFW